MFEMVRPCLPSRRQNLLQHRNCGVSLQTVPHYLFLIYFLCKQMNPYGVPVRRLCDDN